LWTLPFALIEQLSPPALERLTTIQTPTLVLVGENDLAAIREQSLLLEQKFVEARRIVIAGGGHLLNMTSPNAFGDALSEFLNLSEDDRNLNPFGRSCGVPRPPVWHKLGTEREPNCVENLRRRRFQSEKEALPTGPNISSGQKCPKSRNRSIFPPQRT